MSHKLAICALAKNENAYINEWVKYHVDLGVDFIYLYDNNDKDAPYVGDFIEPAYRDKVRVVNVRGHCLRSRQQAAYNSWLRNFQKEADYCAFIDIDEFIVTDSVDSLLSQMPTGVDVMVLNWVNYTDGGLITSDETVPVRERFTTTATRNSKFWSKCVKSIIRCNGSIELRSLNSHGFFYAKKQPIVRCDCSGNSVELVSSLKFTKDRIENPSSYIAHYPTKSLQEYLKYKVDRLGAVWDYPKGKTNYYFRFNERTPEKMKYIADYYESTCNG